MVTISFSISLFLADTPLDDEFLIVLSASATKFKADPANGHVMILVGNTPNTRPLAPQSVDRYHYCAVSFK